MTVHWSDAEREMLDRMRREPFWAEMGELSKAPAGLGGVRYFDPDGDPVDNVEWAVLFARDRRVGLLQTDKLSISTVYIGMCMGFNGEGTVGLYETLVEGEHEEAGGDIIRHSTRAEAVAAFNALVASATVDEADIIEKVEAHL